MDEKRCVDCKLSVGELEQRLSGEWVHPHPVFCVEALQEALREAEARAQAAEERVQELERFASSVAAAYSNYDWDSLEELLGEPTE